MFALGCKEDGPTGFIGSEPSRLNVARWRGPAKAIAPSDSGDVQRTRNIFQGTRWPLNR